MQNLRCCLLPLIRVLPVLFLAGMACGYAGICVAMVFTLKEAAPPEIQIRVGGGGKSIHTVSFDVPLANAGDGTPVAGSRRIWIHLELRTTAATPLTGFLTVDSSTPLDNGTGGTIPVSDISWTTQDGELPSGSFAGTSNQLLTSFSGSIRVRDRLSFSFANDTLYDAGTYTGQVIYTWSAP